MVGAVGLVLSSCVEDVMVASRTDASALSTIEGGTESDSATAPPSDAGAAMDASANDRDQGLTMDRAAADVAAETETAVDVADGSLGTDRPENPDAGDLTDAPDVGTTDVGIGDIGMSDVPTVGLDASDAGTDAQVSDRTEAPDRTEVDVPPGWVVCTSEGGGAAAVDPRTDINHCGGCNRRCCGRFCVDGRCTADGPPGTLACPLTPEEERVRGCFGDIQVNPRNDPNHCGTCGTRCGPGQSCNNFMCSGG